MRSYVVEQLGDPGAVLVVDATGDVKKGTATPGVQRQYTGTAGRIENAQVAVYLGYAAPRGHALIDRALYLPKSWTGDPGRCEAAGIPGHAAFATIPAGVGRTVRANELAARLPRRAWQRLSAGDGAKGHRWYDWAWVTISNPGRGHRCLLIRRNRSTGELAFYHCYSPQRVTLAALVKVAGLRWTIEENFQAGKGLTGLDEHQVRRWNSWYRWVTLAMLGAGVLEASRNRPCGQPDGLLRATHRPDSRSATRRIRSKSVADGVTLPEA